MLLVQPPGVYPAQGDTWLLAEVLRREPVFAPGSRVLDLGTGSGALAVIAAQHGAAEVTAVDVSRRALATAWLNARRRGLRVRVRRGDLGGPVDGERFDLVLSNPPYVPAAVDRLPQRGVARAFDGGCDGRAVLDRVGAQAARLLVPGGTLLLVHSALCGVAETEERLDAEGFDVAVVARRTQPFGPVLRARATFLERRGLVAAGHREEELVVLRAARR